jgi:type IV pilus assembly protein PilF
MVYLRVCLVLVVCLVLTGCSPLALVGAVGTTINNAAYNAAEREANSPKQSRDEQAFQVAIANMNLGVEYMRQGDYENALVKLNRSLRAKPDFAPSYGVLGLLYQKLGNNIEAEKSFKKAITLDPSDSSTFNNYGLFLCSNDRLDEAEGAFINAANNPFYDSPEIALTNAGICIFDTKPELGLEYFKQALNKNPNYPYALIEIADIHYVNNEYDEAFQYFDRYENAASHTPKSLWLGIRICEELGYEDNVSSYTLLLRNKFPDSEEAKMLAEWSF